MIKKEIPVSIIMPAFDINKSEPALKHILKQDYTNLEIILINDNPKSKPSPSMLKFIKSNKIRLINNPSNMGIAKSLNEGIKAAKTNTISILCRDYFPENKQWLRHVMEKLYSDEKIDFVGSAVDNARGVWNNYNFLIKLFTFRNMIKRGGGGGNYKKEVFNKIGLFDTNTFRFAGEDGDMHARMKKAGYGTEYIKDCIIHNHYEKNDTLSKVLRKEYHYGMGHGARKKKYGILKRVGLFDFDIRILFIIGFIVGLFTNPLISLVCFLPFFLVALIQSIDPYSQTKWIPGLLLYPFAGIFILLVQTTGAIKEYLRVKQDKQNKNIEYLGR